MQRSTIRKIALGVAITAAFGWCVYAALIIGMAKGGVVFDPPIDVIVLSVLGMLVGLFGVIDRVFKEHTARPNDTTQVIPILQPRERFTNRGTVYPTVPQQYTPRSRRRSPDPDVVRFPTMEDREERMTERLRDFTYGAWAAKQEEEPPSGDLAQPGTSP